MLMCLAISMMVMAQGKLTPQAQLSIQKQKAKIERRANAKGQMPQTAMVKLVVQVDANHAKETFQQMKAAGATLRTKLGHQATVMIPADSVPALERIEGVVRIDKGHQGRMKTDVTRKETGVSLLNGAELPEGATLYSGKGVNICLIDMGFDFQHPAFKDAEGRSRIKCVYLNNSEQGHKFTVSDPEAGEYTFPGSVFDTPELIAQLTTDDTEEYHGTHTASIAAGSVSPQGYGGMAPDADLVMIPTGYVDEDLYEDIDDMIEELLAFAAAYANQSEQPTVLSASMNSHSGPHDGSSSVTHAIEATSDYLIPVLSAGNEGGYPIHLYKKFTKEGETVKTLMIGIADDESGEHTYLNLSDVVGYTRAGNKVGIQLALRTISMMGRVAEVWRSETVTATIGGDMQYIYIEDGDDATLSQHFSGEIGLAAADMGDGRLTVSAMINGATDPKGNVYLYIFELDVIGDAGTEIDLWDDFAGFGGKEFIGLSGYVDGDNLMSAGDWTCTDRVVSVGAYCTNVICRDYDGNTQDTSQGEDDDDDVDVLNDIAWFSSFGTSFNNVVQPTVCAPGVNIVSAWNQYCIGEDETLAESMAWDGAPYGAESGTSMACPVVGGIVALWLEANPDLTFDEIKDVMEQSSVNDEFTAQDAARWGYGKINAARGIEYITTGHTGIREISKEQTTSSDSYLYDLQGRRISQRPVHGLYIYQGRKIAVR